EVWQLAEGEVDLHDTGAGLPALDVAGEVRRQVLPAHVVKEGGLRVQRGDDDLGRYLVAVVQDDAGGPAAARGDGDLDDAGAGPDRDAERPGGAGDRGGDRAHAALGEAPAAKAAVADVTDRVVRHHVGGAWLVRARPGADHAVDGEGALDLRASEPVVQQVGDRHRHQPRDVGDGPHAEAAVAPRQPQGAREVPRLAGTKVRRNGQQQ